MINPESCAECAIVAGDAGARRGAFVVHVRPEPAPAPWLIVAPRRHVEQIDALDGDELAALGPIIAEAAAALRAATGCEKIYVAVFAEVLHHLHVHVVARGAEVPEEARGARIFQAATVANAGDRARGALDALRL